jgi:branched-chain amino acid transport system ATP-binding protein|tara:strand:- start:891 stop:2228 length:1338 start_codon:yes stop_codon:yes gene_type:complete
MVNRMKKDRKIKRATSEQQPLLSCRRVTKSYGALNAVDKLTFDVQAGTVFGIGGPNGAGKTTLYDVICGIAPATSGDIFLDGKSIVNMAPHEVCHQGIARTFQMNASFDTLTVRDNVMLAAHHGHMLKELPKFFFNDEERYRADNALDLTGLRDKADEIVSDLNLVDSKLLMIAAALATSPRILMMDEPVGGLVPQEIDQVEAVVRRLTEEKGITVILIEHVMRFLVGLSDEVMIMNQGGKLYQGTPLGLAHDKAVVEVYLGEGSSGQINAKPIKAPILEAKLTNLDADEMFIEDAWSQDVASAARQLLKQYRAGRIYPIDYMNLDTLLGQRADSDKATKIARAAQGVMKAHNAGSSEAQPFELLASMLEEAHLTNSKRILATDVKEDKALMRAKAIEKAARAVIQGESNNLLGKQELDELKAALFWSVANNADPDSINKELHHE